jgi:hypothetical protein
MPSSGTIGTQFVRHRKHYVSAAELSQLILCKIWGFQAVAMKNAVFWDIKTQSVRHRKHYISTAEPSQLVVCKIWGFQAVAMKSAVFWDVTLVRTDVSEERVASISELGTTFALTQKTSFFMVLSGWRIVGVWWNRCRRRDAHDGNANSRRKYYVVVTLWIQTASSIHNNDNNRH